MFRDITKYEAERKKADFELRRRLISPIKNIVPPMPLPGSLEREHMIHVFRPTSNNPGILPLPCSNESLNGGESMNNRMDTTRETSIIRDSGTGEELKFTASKWSSREGRVNLDSKSIIAVGTGRLDIAHNLVCLNNEDLSLHSSEFDSPTRRERHSLVQQFLKRGPLIPMFHRDWDPKTDSVKNQVNYDIHHDRDSDSGSDCSDSDNPSAKMTTKDPLENVSLTKHQICSPSKQSHPHKDSLAPLRTPIQNPFPLLPPKSPLIISNPHLSPSHKSRSPPSSRSSSVSNSNIGREIKHLHIATRQPFQVKSAHMEWANSPQDWLALENKYFDDILGLVSQLEMNKSLTGEKRRPGGDKGIKSTCRDIAKLRRQNMQDLLKAVADEEQRELLRQAEEDSCKKPLRLRKLQEQHERERKEKRVYMRTLKHDQEVMFIRKMEEIEILW